MWKLARLLLTRPIARSLGNSWASCTFLVPAHLGSPGKVPPCRWKIFPERGVVRVRRTVLEFYTPCNFSATANAGDSKFCTRVGHASLVMSECFLSGRGQGHMSNFYTVDLENFATASRPYTGDIHNSTVVGLFITPEAMGADSVASWLSAHCLSRIASD